MTRCAVSSCDFVVRLARHSDAEALLALVRSASGALEKISPDPAAIAALIDCSTRSLNGHARAAEESYLFLLENLADHSLAGCAVLQCHIGLEEPFYDYRVGQSVHSSRQLKSYRCLDVLYLCNDLTGASEAHSIYVLPPARLQGGGQLLLKALALFIAQHAERFARRLIVELRGSGDDIGASPFWEAVGRHFFKVDQRAAERLVAQGRKSFIAELMPKFPVYVALLPEAARNAVASVHAEVQPLLAALEHEGFHYESHIDIFDAGRVMEAHTHELACVAGSMPAEAKAGVIDDAAARFWIAAGQGKDFSVRQARGRLDPATTDSAAAFVCAAATMDVLPESSAGKVRLLRA